MHRLSARVRATQDVLTITGKDLIRVGKSPECEISLEARGVSRTHCELYWAANKWHVRDLNSTNGTTVAFGDGTISARLRVGETHPLRDKDLLLIGQVQLEILIDDHQLVATEVIEPPGFPAATEVLEPPPEPHPMMVLETLRIAPQMVRPASSASHRSQAVTSASSTKEPPDERQLPRRMRDYELLKVLGKGGMGIVYLAKHTKAGSPHAIKFLRQPASATDKDRLRFLREMDVAMKLNHPTLTQCIDCGDESGDLYMVMEYCNGGNLAQLLQRSGTLNLRRALRLLDRLLSGVEYAHDQGIVHRDLKPSNILLHKDSQGKYVPKISDFGLAKSYLTAGESEMTVQGSVGGSWPYMPREQLTNFRFLAPESDVWALGAIFYETVSGRLPREVEKGRDPIKTIIESKLICLKDRVPDIPQVVSDFAMKCLANQPEDRFRHGKAMRARLRKVAEAVGVAL